MSNKAKILCLVGGWQIVVYALAVAGIFPEIFSLLGIPWNSVGWRNVLGTAVGFLLLELPAVFFIAWFWFSGRKRTD